MQRAGRLHGGQRHTDLPGRRDEQDPFRWSATRSTRPTRRSSSTSRAPPNATIADGPGPARSPTTTPPPRSRSATSTVTEGNTGTANAIFTVSLGAASGKTVTVDYATADGTATQPADYTAASGRSPSRPARPARRSTSPVMRRHARRGRRDVHGQPVDAANATLADGQGTGTITDDDPPPTLSITDVTVTEGNAGTTNAVFTVSLGAASGKTVTVDYATADGTATAAGRLHGRTGTLTFAPGETSRRSRSPSPATRSTSPTRRSSSTSRTPPTRRSPTPGHRRRSPTTTSAPALSSAT